MSGGVHFASHVYFRISDLGQQIGLKLFDLIQWKDKSAKKDTTFLALLISITNGFWRIICGKPVDSLERSVQSEQECNSLLMKFKLFVF